ncbi:response regulator [Paenibacillus sp. KQZ6P-2]|uniref:Response regulator n=1 Tax=Paenibacillus mangrovi TaxID=2931978 RepID=A0A9X1WM79_9BACL|nr:response regulator [Paenibacillus mangrovi]MCJ8010435.1 response regulator [Paenibacillus mangrovi]
MYSIFLVDDEHIELEMMRDFIRWEDMEIYVAGTAVNGKDALEKIKMIQPDIILTDVKMPLMNGIELATQVSEEFDWIKIVFLTGYDEFEYVKSALNVGAVGYILKPLDLGEIADVMDRVKKKCEEVRMKNKSIQVTKSNIVKELIYEKKPKRRENLTNSFNRLERSEQGVQFTLVLCSIDPDHMLQHEIQLEDSITSLEEFINQYCIENEVHVTVLSLKEGEWSLLVDSNQLHANRTFWSGIAGAIRQHFSFTVTMAVSEKYDELTNVHLLYEQVKNITNERYYIGYGNVIYAGDIDGKFQSDQMPPFLENKLFEAVMQFDQEQVESIIQEFFSNLVHLRIYQKHVCNWAIDMIDHLNEYISNDGTDIYALIVSRADLYHSIYECPIIAEVEAKIFHICKRTIELIMNRHTDKNEKLVHQVRTLIQHSYHDQITISSLSSQVYLSPNYLRSLFKENTGITIHDYITKVRLEKAKELLGDASLRVHDIAQKVGYESASYFCSLFLKSQGVTPNEYRKNL